MIYLKILIALSGISFITYALSYFLNPKMRVEFEKLQISRFGKLVGAFEFLGGLGMLIGLLSTPILRLSSLGLTVMMVLALIIRIVHMNHFKFMLQAILFIGINGYIFYESLSM